MKKIPLISVFWFLLCGTVMPLPFIPTIAPTPIPVPYPFSFYPPSLTLHGQSASIAADASVVGFTSSGGSYMYHKSGIAYPGPVTTPAGNLISLNKNDGTILADSNQGNSDVYIYTRSGTTWTYLQTLTGNGNSSSVATTISGDGTRLAISRFNSGSCGSVQIHLKTATYASEQIITDPVCVANDGYGNYLSMARDGSRLVIAGTQISAVQTNAGRIWVYSRTGTVWSLEQTIDAPTPTAQEFFGYRVSISGDGNFLIVSTAGTGTALQALYLYSRTGTAWTYRQKITSPNPIASGFFGVSLNQNYDGTKVIVGAPGETAGGLTGAGNVYVYSRSGNTLTLFRTLTSPKPKTTGNFGGRPLNSSMAAWNAADIDDTGLIFAVGGTKEDDGTASNRGYGHIMN